MNCQGYSGKLALFLDFCRNHFADYSEVPDPYYGGDQGFSLVLDLIEDASAGYASDQGASMTEALSADINIDQSIDLNN